MNKIIGLVHHNAPESQTNNVIKSQSTSIDVIMYRGVASLSKSFEKKDSSQHGSTFFFFFFVVVVVVVKIELELKYAPRAFKPVQYFLSNFFDECADGLYSCCRSFFYNSFGYNYFRSMFIPFLLSGMLFLLLAG